MVHLPLSAETVRLIVLDAGFVADCCEDALHKQSVERSRHAHCDGEDGGVSIATQTMQSLTPPLEDGHIEALNCLRVVHHEPHFLLQRQALAEIQSTFLRTELRILVGILCERV